MGPSFSRVVYHHIFSNKEKKEESSASETFRMGGGRRQGNRGGVEKERESERKKWTVSMLMYFPCFSVLIIFGLMDCSVPEFLFQHIFIIAVPSRSETHHLAALLKPQKV